jgi:hypothetical protein
LNCAVAVVLARAEKIGASELTRQLRALIQQLAGMDASVGRISGTRRLVRLIKTLS